jgi:hypothetical protein
MLTQYQLYSALVSVWLLKHDINKQWKVSSHMLLVFSPTTYERINQNSIPFWIVPIKN